MASKRLSRLKTGELEPSEQDLADEGVDTFNLNGVLSLTREEDMNDYSNSNGKARGNSIASSVSHGSQDGKEDERSSDDSYENIHSVSTLNTSISRGLSISIIREKTVKINFDIIDAKITEGHRKHVVYVLAITRTPGLDSDKAFIERRYSDFFKLYKELKKMFSDFIKSIDFPERKIVGNLKETLISERTRLLQNFIRNIYENEEIRNSETFKKFFYISSLEQGCQKICLGSFEQALNFLLNGLHLQQKLALDSTSEVIATLSNIVECHMSLKSYDEVVNYSLAALELIENDLSSIFLVPLLQTLQNAYVVLGDERKDDIERRLREIVSVNQIEVEHLPSLRELAVKRFTKK